MFSKPIRILIGGLGHPTKMSLVNSIKSNNERTIQVVGMDCDESGINPSIVDQFCKVPREKDPSYLEALLTLCKEQAIDIYYASGEGEALLTAQRQDKFDELGVKIIRIGDEKLVGTIINKIKWHQQLKSSGIPVANFEIIASIGDLERAVISLGYPDKEVIVKPAMGMGGRGVVRISENVKYDRESKSDGIGFQSLLQFKRLLEHNTENEFSPLLATEYLKGTSYSVDVLSHDKKPVYIIPKIRLKGTASFTSVAEVDMNREVIEYINKISSCLACDYLQNYELKYNDFGQPIVFDINPRGGASVDCCRAAGANIMYFAIKKALGEAIPIVEVIDKTKMIRNMTEYYQLP